MEETIEEWRNKLTVAIDIYLQGAREIVERIDKSMIEAQKLSGEEKFDFYYNHVYKSYQTNSKNIKMLRNLQSELPLIEKYNPLRTQLKNNIRLIENSARENIESLSTLQECSETLKWLTE